MELFHFLHLKLKVQNVDANYPSKGMETLLWYRLFTSVQKMWFALLIDKQLVHENVPTTGHLCLMSVRECI